MESPGSLPQSTCFIRFLCCKIKKRLEHFRKFLSACVRFELTIAVSVAQIQYEFGNDFNKEANPVVIEMHKDSFLQFGFLCS